MSAAQFHRHDVVGCLLYCIFSFNNPAVLKQYLTSTFNTRDEYNQFIMTTRIPTSTSITESSVIPAPLAQVWHLIKLQDFHQFWTKLAKSEHVKGASPETDIVKWTFKDGTEQEVKQEEHSVCDLPSRNSLDKFS